MLRESNEISPSIPQELKELWDYIIQTHFTDEKIEILRGLMF